MTTLTCTTCDAPGPARVSKRTPGARAATIALAFAALALVGYGEHWMLESAPAAGSELVAATTAIDTIYASSTSAFAGAERPEITRDTSHE